MSAEQIGPIFTDTVASDVVIGNGTGGRWLILVRPSPMTALDYKQTRAFANELAGRWNALRDALAEYDNPRPRVTSTTAHNMADILRRALNGEG